jgi:hypothetical protein
VRAIGTRHSCGMKPSKHHELCCAEIEAMARGQLAKLTLIVPRGSAKTTYVSHLAPNSNNVLAAVWSRL